VLNDEDVELFIDGIIIGNIQSLYNMDIPSKVTDK